MNPYQPHQSDLDFIETGFPPTRFAEPEPFDLRGNVICALIGGLCGLGVMLAIGISVGLFVHGLPWLRALWTALV